MLALAGLGAAALVVLPRASASAVPDTTPALAATGPTAMSLVWHGSAPRRLHEQTSAGGHWGEPAVFSGPRPPGDTSGVGLAADPATGTVLTAAVADEQVWVRTRPGGAWSGLGGQATGAPAVAGLGGGAFAVVVRDDEGTVRTRYLRAGRWSGWSSLGGRVSTSPAAAGRAGTLVVAAVGAKRQVRTTVVTGGRASGWRNTGVVSTATPGLATEPRTGVLHLITRNRDLSPSARMSVDGTRTWSRATRLDGRLGSGIAATSREPGTVDIAAMALDGRVVQSTRRAGRWGEFRLVAAGRATVLDENALSEVIGDPAGPRTLRLAAGTPVPAKGEILAATSTPVTPDGLLVKVESVAGRLVRATPARLDEAVPSGTIDETFTLSSADRSAAGPLVQPISRSLSCSNGAKAEVTGSVSIAPKFDFDASWTPRGVSAVSFTGTLTEDAQLRASISGSAACSLKKTALLSQPVRFRPFVFSVGPVPVVITPQLQLYLDATGSVQAALTTAAGQTASVRAGLSYRDGAVSPVSSLTSTFTHQPPTVSRTATAQTGVAPTFTFLMYGVAGPQLTTRAYVQMEAEDPQWTLRAGLTAGVKLAVPQLGVDHSRDDVVRHSRTLATGTSTPPATGTRTTIGTGRTTARVGDRITVTGKVLHADGSPVQNGFLSVAWHSPKRDGKGQVTSLRTGADGSYSLTVTVDEKGQHSFSTVFPGSADADNGSDARTTVTVS